MRKTLARKDPYSVSLPFLRTFPQLDREDRERHARRSGSMERRDRALATIWSLQNSSLTRLFAGLFPSSKPTPETPFTMYASTSNAANGPRALAAETATMEWESRNHMGVDTNDVGEVSGEGAGYSTQ